MAARTKKTAAASASPSEDDLNRALLSEKVRGARLANDRTEAEHTREHSVEGESHFNRRRTAATSETESKAEGARQKVGHEHEMHRFAVHEATQAHQQRTAVNVHQKAMHQHEQEAARLKNERAASDERRAEESHQQTLAIKAQQAHATAHAHRRGAAVHAAHLLFGGAGGSAKTAMRGQVGGGH